MSDAALTPTATQIAPVPVLRADLAGLPVYKPGRQATSGFKVSSNESPFPPLPSVLEAIAQTARTTNRYPDLAATAVVDAVAARFDVAADRVVVGCGSVSLCTQLVLAFAGAGDEVIFPWRSFEAYPILVQVAGARAVPVPLTPTEEHDLDAMAAAVTDRTRVVFVCNPNNPTGTAIRREALDAFLDAVPTRVLVVLDEAYEEFVRDPGVPDGIALYGERPNVAVLRTFSKAYGLAGLRVGYLVAHPAVADAARITTTPFAVTSVAQAAAVASLAPEAERELLARVDATVAERDRVTTGLLERGWSVPPPQGNFVWLRLGERTGAFAQACETAGLTIRAFDGEGARVTIAEPAANDLLLAVAATFPAADPAAPSQATDRGPA